MGYRSCLGLLNLAKRFGRERLEAACQRALQLGSPNRRSVVSLLEQRLDRLPLPEPTVAQPPLFHENIRGPGERRSEALKSVRTPWPTTGQVRAGQIHHALLDYGCIERRLAS